MGLEKAYHTIHLLENDAREIVDGSVRQGRTSENETLKQFQSLWTADRP